VLSGQQKCKAGKYKVEVAAYISKGNTPVFIFDEVEFEIVEEKQPKQHLILP